MPLLSQTPSRHSLMLVIIASICVAFAPFAAMAETAEPEVQQKAASVTVAKAVMAEIVGQVSISGSLVAQEEILVFPQVNGSTIDTLLVDTGDTVALGQVLATLNNRTMTAQLAQAQAEFARAEASVSQARNQITSMAASETQAAAALERATALRRNGSGTQAALDLAIANQQTAASAVASSKDGLAVALAQQQQAQASLDIANLNLDRTTLRAPAAGVISARNGQVGAIAASGGEPIFRIIRDGKIEVEAEVIETALGSISVDDPAQLRIAGNGTVSGTVRRISPTVDPRSRLGTIRITIKDDATLRTGVFASGEITTVNRQSITVPTTAVLNDSDGTFVLAVIDGRLKKRAVVARLIWQGKREIFDGLQEGDVVVARAGAFFGDGDAITPIFSEAEAVK